MSPALRRDPLRDRGCRVQALSWEISVEIGFSHLSRPRGSGVCGGRRQPQVSGGSAWPALFSHRVWLHSCSLTASSALYWTMCILRQGRPLGQVAQHDPAEEQPL